MDGRGSVLQEGMGSWQPQRNWHCEVVNLSSCRDPVNVAQICFVQVDNSGKEYSNGGVSLKGLVNGQRTPLSTTNTHARTHAHTHARTHARTHTHTHTHTRTGRRHLKEKVIYDIVKGSYVNVRFQSVAYPYDVSGETRVKSRCK